MAAAVIAGLLLAGVGGAETVAVAVGNGSGNGDRAGAGKGIAAGECCCMTRH